MAEFTIAATSSAARSTGPASEATRCGLRSKTERTEYERLHRQTERAVARVGVADIHLDCPRPLGRAFGPSVPGVRVGVAAPPGAGSPGPSVPVARALRATALWICRDHAGRHLDVAAGLR